MLLWQIPESNNLKTAGLFWIMVSGVSYHHCGMGWLSRAIHIMSTRKYKDAYTGWLPSFPLFFLAGFGAYVVLPTLKKEFPQQPSIKEDILTRHLCLSIYQTTKTKTPKEMENLPGISCWEKGKTTAAMGMVSHKEISHSSNNLSDLLTG